jgi:1,4-alpha-glucan branching enzyme
MRTGLARVAAIVLTLVGSSCAAATNASPPIVTPSGVRFSLGHAEAKSVALVGQFNQWSASSHPLSKDARSGMWTVVVPLPPGEHAFMYVVDGTQWITPPLADDFVDDGFGAKNGVVIVRAAEQPAAPKPDGEGG